MEAKDYLSKHQVPQLFECLLTGLMFNKPENPVTYLRECLMQIENQSLAQVKWDLFLQSRQIKAKLPAIQSESVLSRESSRILSGGSNDSRRPAPLPPISPSVQKVANDSLIVEQPLQAASQLKVSPDAAFVLLIGGPGTSKSIYGQNLAMCWPSFVHISIGQAFRRHIARQGNAESRWKVAEALTSRGELAPEELELIFNRFSSKETTVGLVAEQINQHKDAKGFIIDGYPRTIAQVEQWCQLVKSTALVLLIDAEQMTMMTTLLRRGAEHGSLGDSPSAIARRVAFFKNQTLPVCKIFDEQGLLRVVDGEQPPEEVYQALVKAIAEKFGPPLPGHERLVIPRPPSTPKIGGRAPNAGGTPSAEEPLPDLSFRKVEFIRELKPEVPDTGRKAGLPQCPIILLLGGPGSGQSHQATAICARYRGFQHISAQDIAKARVLEEGEADRTWAMMSSLVISGEVGADEVTAEMVVAEMLRLPVAETSCILLEGFPRNAKQLEEFNQHIGRADIVVLLDCEELYMTLRLLERGKDTGRLDDNLAAIGKRMNVYKEETLPIVRHYDKEGKLVVIFGDRDATEVFYDFCRFIDFTFFPPPAKPVEEEDEELGDEVVEEEIVAEKATLLYADDDDNEADSAKKSQDGLKQCKVVFVTGGPGSGKGTQCEKILNDFDVGHVSTGDLIRAEVESASERATQLKETMEKGELVSLDIVLELLKEHLTKNSSKHKGFLIDGYPREMEQATRFEKEVVECLCMVYMDASEDVMKNRILERAKTSGRSDDNEETITKRIETFRSNNEAIVKHFEEKSKLVRIDCNSDDVDAIYASVREALEKSGLPLKGAEEAPAAAAEAETTAKEGEATGDGEAKTAEAPKENGDAATPAAEAPKEAPAEEAPAETAAAAE